MLFNTAFWQPVIPTWNLSNIYPMTVTPGTYANYNTITGSGGNRWVNAYRITVDTALSDWMVSTFLNAETAYPPITYAMNNPYASLVYSSATNSFSGYMTYRVNQYDGLTNPETLALKFNATDAVGNNESIWFAPTLLDYDTIVDPSVMNLEFDLPATQGSGLLRMVYSNSDNLTYFQGFAYPKGNNNNLQLNVHNSNGFTNWQCQLFAYAYELGSVTDTAPTGPGAPAGSFYQSPIYSGSAGQTPLLYGTSINLVQARSFVILIRSGSMSAATEFAVNLSIV